MTLRIHYRRLVRQTRSALVGGPPSDEDRNIWPWYVSTALVGVYDAGMLVFLPVFLARLGATPTLIGLYNSLPALFSMVLLLPAGILVGRVADQMRAMVRIATTTRLILLALVLAPFFLGGHDLALAIVVLWTLKTIPEAGSIPLWMSIAARAVSPRRRAHVNGTRWALLAGVSALAQSFFGGWLDGRPFPAGYQAVFGAALVASVLELGFFSRLRVPILAGEEGSTGVAGFGVRLRDYVRSLAEHRAFLRYQAATFAFRLALNIPAALYALLWVRELGASDGLIGLRGSVGYGALVLGYLFWGRCANRLTHRRVLRICALGFAGYALASALTPTAGWLPAIAVIWGLSAPGIDIGLFDLFLSACPRGREARLASLHQFAVNLAMFAGPLVGVALANVTSIRTALVVAAGLQALTILPFALLPRDV